MTKADVSEVGGRAADNILCSARAAAALPQSRMAASGSHLRLFREIVGGSARRLSCARLHCRQAFAAASDPPSPPRPSSPRKPVPHKPGATAQSVARATRSFTLSAGFSCRSLEATGDRIMEELESKLGCFSLEPTVSRQPLMTPLWASRFTPALPGPMTHRDNRSTAGYDALPPECNGTEQALPDIA